MHLLYLVVRQGTFDHGKFVLHWHFGLCYSSHCTTRIFGCVHTLGGACSHYGRRSDGHVGEAPSASVLRGLLLEEKQYLQEKPNANLEPGRMIAPLQVISPSMVGLMT
jgi:hypothetical protein